MGLKAINDGKFGDMVEVLDSLEKIRNLIGHENLDSWELQDLRVRLQDKHKRYKEMLSDIEAQIEDFDKLYRVVRMRFLPDMIKELKHILSEESKEFMLLKEIIQKTYRH